MYQWISLRGSFDSSLKSSIQFIVKNKPVLRYVSENSGVCQDTSIILTVFGQQDVEQYNFEELLVPVKCTGLNFMKGNFVTVYLKNIIKSTCHYYELLFKLLSKIQCSKFIVEFSSSSLHLGTNFVEKNVCHWFIKLLQTVVRTKLMTISLCHLEQYKLQFPCWIFFT